MQEERLFVSEILMLSEHSSLCPSEIDQTSEFKSGVCCFSFPCAFGTFAVIYIKVILNYKSRSLVK